MVGIESKMIYPYSLKTSRQTRYVLKGITEFVNDIYLVSETSNDYALKIDHHSNICDHNIMLPT